MYFDLKTVFPHTTLLFFPFYDNTLGTQGSSAGRKNPNFPLRNYIYPFGPFYNSFFPDLSTF
jgi:hypothetical protein